MILNGVMTVDARILCGSWACSWHGNYRDGKPISVGAERESALGNVMRHIFAGSYKPE